MRPVGVWVALFWLLVLGACAVVWAAMGSPWLAAALGFCAGFWAHEAQAAYYRGIVQRVINGDVRMRQGYETWKAQLVKLAEDQQARDEARNKEPK